MAAELILTNYILLCCQVVAREAWEGGAASVPITLTVELNDVNDNPPRLPVYPPLAVQAGAARRVISQVGFTILN